MVDNNKPLAEVKKPTAKPIPSAKPQENSKVTEHGGPKGLEPTRFGDWEKGGRCFDF